MKYLLLTLPIFVFGSLNLSGAVELAGAGYVFVRETSFSSNSDRQFFGTDDTVSLKLSDGFGVLDQSSEFTIRGFSIDLAKTGGTVAQSVTMRWSVDNFITFNEITASESSPFDAALWAVSVSTQSLLTNNGQGQLAPDDYTFSVYFIVETNGIDSPVLVTFDNGGSNFTGDFTVIPEPAMVGLLLSIFPIALLILRRTR
jgi:hypothetical protein